MIRKVVRKHPLVYFLIKRTIFLFKYELPQKLLGDKYLIQLKYYRKFGFPLDIVNPKRLTEKIQWLKLYDRKPINTLFADKIACSDYLSDRFGSEYRIPVIYRTKRIKDITPEVIPDYPCVIKLNNGCGTYQFIYDKEDIDWNELRGKFLEWKYNNHYYKSQEWQYKNVAQEFFIEKMMLCKDASLPNDYKFHYINGKLSFIHCNVNKDPSNKYKIIYDCEWNPIHFSWDKTSGDSTYARGREIDKPLSFEKMCYIGEEVAKQFKYVRVDFYDVDGKMYFGEVTLYHGSGLNRFSPDYYDTYYGDMLIL